MRIIFEFENERSPEQIKQMYEGDTGIILTQMKELVRQRLSVLKEEIEWQQGYTMICIGTQSKIEIRHYNVTADLGYKMTACFSQRDYDYIMEKVWKALYPGKLPPTS